VKYKQIKLRLDALIMKHKQMIRGYNLAKRNTKSSRKRISYMCQISKLKGSIERIEKALHFLETAPRQNITGDINFNQFCNRFGFYGRKTERRS
jgi:hypothetical protein